MIPVPSRAETLAEAFLADFEEDEEDDVGSSSSLPPFGGDDVDGDVSMKDGDADGDDDDDDGGIDHAVGAVDGSLSDDPSFGDTAKLFSTLKAFLDRVDELDGASADGGESGASVSSAAAATTTTTTTTMGKGNPEYDTIVEAASMTALIDEGIGVLHGKVRDLYCKKFPELESVVVNPLEYVQAVQAIGNVEDLSSVDLSDILPGAVSMSISITASHTEGVVLPAEDMSKIDGLCDKVFQLQRGLQRILAFVEGRMHIIAPNLSVLVGSAIAAKLMGIAGGLEALSQIPACNIQRLGTQRKILAGFSTASTQIHTGVINDCELVSMSPAYLRPKVRRWVAGRCALVARADQHSSAPDASLGEKFKSEIQGKIMKEQEPPPPKKVRAIKPPDRERKKRRGGKRFRRMKEKYAQTELRKQANRMKFGTEAEDTYGLSGRGFGMIGKSGSGKVRLSAEEKGLIARKKARKLAGSRTSVGATSGLSSSLAFTPVQGLELENPDAEAIKEAKADANAKYFSAEADFLRVKREVKVDPTGVFAVPPPRPPVAKREVKKEES